MTPRRGDVWLLDLGDPIGREQSGHRPAVVVSDDRMNDGSSGLVIVIPVTTAHRGLPSHIELDDPANGLDEPSHAKCEDVKSVSVDRMVTRFGTVGPVEMSRIESVLRILLRL